MNNNQTIRVVTIQIELAIPNDDCECLNRDDVCNYLNKKLYEDPEFFGEFGQENSRYYSLVVYPSITS